MATGKESDRDGHRWSKTVTERKPATFAHKDIHKQSAQKIFEEYSRPSVSPRGLGSAIQMLVFYVNRAGKNLGTRHKQSIEKAIRMLHRQNERQKAKKAAKTGA